MARLLNRLNPRAVTTITKPGRHADGGGLYLSVGPGAARRWVFLFRWRGKLKEMGLGSGSSVPLARAREKAAAAREQVADGLNPLEVKRASAAVPTFGELADAVVKDLGPQWKNEKHKAQWKATLTTDAAKLRPLRVDKIETTDILDALKPIWNEKPETASRLRGRIERVLEAAKAKGFRTGENPARWKGHLDHVLPKRRKLTRGHHAALPFAEVPAFIGELRGRTGAAALALEFAILTAARSGEVRRATWGEIDLKAKLWTVPAERMKAGRVHRVPLCDRAVAILESVQVLSDGAGGSLVFPGPKAEVGLSDAAFSALLKRMGKAPGTLTPHGFRSSFRDWAGEVSTFPRDVAEMALAHAVGDMTEQAYRRGDALKKRKALMDAWARYCEPGRTGNIVALARQSS